MKNNFDNYRFGQIFTAVLFCASGYFIENYPHLFPMFIQSHSRFISNSFLIIGLLMIVEWVFAIYIWKFISPYILRIGEKISIHIIVPVFVSLLVLLFIGPKALSYYKNKELRAKSIDVIVEAVNNSESLEVKEAALIALARINSKYSLDAINEASIADPRLASLKNILLSSKKQKDYSYASNKVVHELKKVESNKVLSEIDFSNSISAQIASSMEKLRRIRKRMTENESTRNEQRMIDGLNVIAKIDDAIEDMNKYYEDYEYSEGDSLQFNAVLNDLLSLFQKFDVESRKGMPKAEALSCFTKFNDNLEDIVDRIWSDKRPEDDELAKYVVMVDAIANSNSDRYTETLVSLVENHEVARTIRCRAAAGLGLIGDAGDLDVLLEAYEDSDPDIQRSVLFGMGMILTNKEGVSGYNNIPDVH